jgi:hypothetical protein
MPRWRFAWLGVLYEMMAFEIRYHAPNKTLARWVGYTFLIAGGHREGTTLLGLWIIAVDSPADRIRRTGPDEGRMQFAAEDSKKMLTNQLAIFS